MKNLFKSFVRGVSYYGVALYILLSFLFNASMDWWIFSTVFFAAIFCFVDILSTQVIRDMMLSESYWRNEYFAEKNLFELEKDSHNGTKKYYINKIKDIDKQVAEKMTVAEQTIAKLSEEKANLLDSISYYKVAK